MKNIKLKIQFIIISWCVVVFTGCSQSATKYFDKKPEFMQNVQYTKVIKIVDKDTVKAIVDITYLNSSNPEKWDNGRQNFIIGKYFVNGDKKCCKLDLTILQKNEVQLDTSNIEYIEKIVTPIEEKFISKSDPIYENIPLRNNWAEYKLVSYDDKDFKDIEELTFQFKEIGSDPLKKVTAIFTKE